MSDNSEKPPEQEESGSTSSSGSSSGSNSSSNSSSGSNSSSNSSSNSEESSASANTATTSEQVEGDPLHLGNLIIIASKKYGITTGRVIYRSLEMVRLLSQAASDRAVEFPMVDGGARFSPQLGVAGIEILERQESDYYVDLLGARAGEYLEFFTANGAEAAPSGEVEEVIKSPEEDAIRLTDGRTLQFSGVGPEAPIVVIRVRSAMNMAASAAEAAVGGAEIAALTELEAAKAARQAEMLALLNSVLPAGEAAVLPTAEQTFPDSLQREDMFQDLRADLSAKKQTNPRRIRLIEREVDLSIALKNRTTLRDSTGRVTGAAKGAATKLGAAIADSVDPVPAAMPVVPAARTLNLDYYDSTNNTMAYDQTQIEPRWLLELESDAEMLAQIYENGAVGKGFTVEEARAAAAAGRLSNGFSAYMYDLLGHNQQVLTGARAGNGWIVDQEVVRSAGLGGAVQGLQADLPSAEASDKADAPLTLAFLTKDVTDRTYRAIGKQEWIHAKSGQKGLIAPSDPSTVSGYVMLPLKAALALRPPKRPGDLPTALLYSASLQDNNLPTIAQTLRDLYQPGKGSPVHAWTVDVAEADDMDIAAWLDTTLPYAVHPTAALGPRTPQILGVLDAYGIGDQDLSPATSAVIQKWVKSAQQLWKNLLATRRAEIQKVLDTEVERTFQSVTGDDSPLWTADTGIVTSPPLKDLVADIQRRNPTIAMAPTLLTSALSSEAQGDAAPLVWAAIAQIDAREVPLDVTAATDALSASRAYILRRKALQDLELLRLRAAPDLETCEHVRVLEAIRNIRDPLNRSRSLREFIEQYQGGRQGDWITCIKCQKPCVCYHELMELEALAQPARLDAIVKQMMIRFGGERYEGKIVCRNCGQGLREIDYDEGVEFDDEGRAVVERSVLTEEQLADPTETTWAQATADLMPKTEFATKAQQEIAEIVQTVIERAGIVQTPDVVRQIVRYTDLYVRARAPSQAAYEAQRAKALTAAATKIKAGTGAAGVDIPTYTAVIDQLRVTAVTALTALALQSTDPPLTVTTPFPLCKFSREGWPLNPAAKPDGEGAVAYLACAVASIKRDYAPWRNLSWAGLDKLETITKKVLELTAGIIRVIVEGDAKIGMLSFTPELRQTLDRARTDIAAAERRAKVSLQDQLPVGFRPEPAPPRLERPGLERDPLPNVQAAIAGTIDDAMITSMAAALRQQSVAIVSELHAAASASVEPIRSRIEKTKEFVCCPVSIQEADAGALLGAPAQAQLLKARDLLRGAIPTATNAGSHLWPVHEEQVAAPVEQQLDEGTYFKLFLQYCYTGGQVGKKHEFSLGNVCRQCGLAIGKPLDLVDFGKEGAAILAAQEGALKVEVTAESFEALSDAIRRQQILTERPLSTREPWVSGLRQVLEIAGRRGDLTEEEGPKRVISAVDGVLATLPAGPVDELGRATLWTPVAIPYDEARAAVGERIGPLLGGGAGAGGAARADKATKALAAFDALLEDPFVEGPRLAQEYFCSKAEAAGRGYWVTTVTGAKWFAISREHNARLNEILTKNSQWFVGDLTEGAAKVLRRLGETLGPVLRAWIAVIRPATATDTSVWTASEARLVLQAFLTQSWAEAVTPTSWMYRDVAEPEASAAAVADWTRGLMLHAKEQAMRYTRDRIRQIVQERAELERTSVVKEFEDIKDDDQRAAEFMKKSLRIGRWGRGANLSKYDADMFEFENEQRQRMGIMEEPVGPEAAPPAAVVEDFGLGAGGAPEDGYDMADEDQKEEGEDVGGGLDVRC